MEQYYPNLFSPIRVRRMLFKNRIISAPLGAWVFSPDNYLFDYAISMFEEKAKGGAAAVCVGHTEINYKEEDSDGFGLYFDLNLGGTPDGDLRPLTSERIREIIGQYVDCVKKLRTCGFDMVTIHGAHGWMPAGRSPNINGR